MLDTRFPRLPGDVGHPDAFGVPVRRKVVQGAVPRAVVGAAERLCASGLAAQFVDAARALEAEGARAITTSCGFLVLLQQELQTAVRVPVRSSSLLRLPELLARQPRVGVLTISAADLGPDYLLAAGVPPSRLADVVVAGLPAQSHFVQAILGNEEGLDAARAQQEVVAAARALAARVPARSTLVLECTNLPPYTEAIRAATGCATHSLLDDMALTGWCSARA